MSIGFLNVQGLCSKVSEIQVMLTSKQIANLHIFSFCETKLNSSKLSNNFNVHGFKIPFRKDNHTNGGGGILVYVRDQIMAKRKKDFETQDVACLSVEITPNKGKSFLIGSLYRSPAERVEWFDRFEMSLENVLNDKNEIIMFGDFNKVLLNLHGNRDRLI